MKLSAQTTKVITKEITLTGRDILKLLQASINEEIPANATVFFQVPSGGDYSGMALDITDEDHITVEYTIKESI